MRDELIEKIIAVQDELVEMGVKREHIDIERSDDEKLSEELEAVTEQLARRKKFLGENFSEKETEKKKRFFAGWI